MAKLRGRAKAAFLARMERGRRLARGETVRARRSGKRRARGGGAVRRAAGPVAQYVAALGEVAGGKVATPASSPSGVATTPSAALPSEANPVMKRALPFALRSGKFGSFGKGWLL